MPPMTGMSRRARIDGRGTRIWGEGFQLARHLLSTHGGGQSAEAWRENDTQGLHDAERAGLVACPRTFHFEPALLECRRRVGGWLRRDGRHAHGRRRRGW